MVVLTKIEEVLPDQEAHGASYNQDRQYTDHVGVVEVVFHAVAEEVKARVAKGRNRVKHAEPQSTANPITGVKVEKQENTANQLDQ